jgi:hypothetical protein
MAIPAGCFSIVPFGYCLQENKRKRAYEEVKTMLINTPYHKKLLKGSFGENEGQQHQSSFHTCDRAVTRGMPPTRTKSGAPELRSVCRKPGFSSILEIFDFHDRGNVTPHPATTQTRSSCPERSEVFTEAGKEGLPWQY